MIWRLLMLREANRWLEYPGSEELAANPADWGVELPEGARVHSIQPLERQSEPIEDWDTRGSREAVTEWAIFVAVPFDEEEINK